MLAMNNATAMTPIPPIWIRTRMIPCPNADQYVAVSCTTRPVTHTADVEVNNASPKDVHDLLCAAMGSVNKRASTKMTPAKPRMMI